MNKTVGLITFHASHNHGSVLQAYATQQSILKLGHNCEIINFRMPSQKNYYSLYGARHDWALKIRKALLLSYHFQRKQRAAKFETFLRERLICTPEYNSYDDLKGAPTYDVYVSGSDQIWSPSIPEFALSDVDYTGVYFLDFTDGRKIAYASSIGEATADQLQSKAPLLQQFSRLSTREQRGAQILQKITGQTVQVVLDPTLLLTAEDWNTLAGEKPLVKEPYVLLYSLQGIKALRNWGQALGPFCQRQHLKFVSICPFFPVLGANAENRMDTGPCDFLNLIKFARVVFTDSFHGTAFSLNFRKPFFVYQSHGNKDRRKTALLDRFSLSDRILSNLDSIPEIMDITIDYTMAEPLIDAARAASLDYLSDSLLQ